MIAEDPWLAQLFTWFAHDRALRVFACQLRRGSVKSLILPVQACLPRPGALHVVLKLRFRLPRPSTSRSKVSPSIKELKPRWLVPVATMSPGSNGWMDVTHSMILGILWAISLVL